MCGIACKVNYGTARPAEAVDLERMMDVMRHRGPDGRGVRTQGPAGLGHLRLSIIDLETGAQPMCNEDESVWIVFNGEIYNFAELRESLVAKGHQFKSRSDTEVIIHLYEEYGSECPKYLRGMFAFAIWDIPNQRLFAARDRIGIKPLYYYFNGETIWLASEIKGLLADSAVPRNVELSVIDVFLSHHYCAGEDTLLRGIRRVLPGYSMTVERGAVRLAQYWDLEFPEERSGSSFEEAAEELRSLLRETVRDHMISDVPVGFLASGGVDSTALLGFAVEETSRQIETFTIGFDGEGFDDERPYARLASERFGTRHHEISMSADQFRDYLPSYIWHMEDPVCEPPAIALHYVSKLAREHVKVLLSGEGGDEAFGGYPNYRNQLLLERLKPIFGPLRGVAAAGASLAGAATGKHSLSAYGRLLPLKLREHYFSRTSVPGGVLREVKGELYTDSFRDACRAGEGTRYFEQLFAAISGKDVLSQMLYVDSKTWLPDDLLIKADKITMGNSLELRVPFLDHKVMEFAARLPSSYKVKGMETKRVLKRAFHGLVPDEILTRKKMGFPVPYERWLGRELRDYVRETICSERAIARGYFTRRGLEKVLENEERGNRGRKGTFCLLVLELWHQRFIDSAESMVPSGAEVAIAA